jgi:cell division septum initiation protein DivIVA
MAKALLGHLGTADTQLVAEVRRLQQRIHALETEVARLQEENDALGEALARAEVVTDTGLLVMPDEDLAVR